MNLNDISTQLLYTTVPIWAERGNGPSTFATGFVAMIPTAADSPQSVPFLVTTRHALDGAKKIYAELAAKDGEQPSARRVRLSIPSETILQFSSGDLDIAAVPIGPLLN